MDELKLNLTSKFMRGIVTKILAKMIKKAVGIQMDIDLHNVTITAEGGKIHLHANVDAETTNEEFVKLLKNVEMD